MVKTIKISDENYRWLAQLAGKLQEEFAQPVSIDRALTFIHKSKHVSDLAGSWQIPQKQVKKTTTEMQDRWSSWRARFFAKGKK